MHRFQVADSQPQLHAHGDSISMVVSGIEATVSNESNCYMNEPSDSIPSCAAWSRFEDLVPMASCCQIASECQPTQAPPSAMSNLPHPWPPGIGGGESPTPLSEGRINLIDNDPFHHDWPYW